MPITASQRAHAMALQVLIAARLHHGRVVTHDLVDAVMSRDADKEQGKVNKETVRRIIRKQAAGESVRVIFTNTERYWAIREKLHHMEPDAVAALADDIADGGDDDPRAWDKELIRALSAHRSGRPVPSRLWGCTPVSIRLWREPLRNMPKVDDVVDTPHAVYRSGERVLAQVSAAQVRRIVGNLRFKRADFTQDKTGAICVEDRQYVPLRFHMRTVNGGTPERIDSKVARREINNAMMKPGKDGVREMSAHGSMARIVYKDVRGTVELRPATPEEAAATVKPKAERYAPGDPVIVRPVVYDPEKRRHRVLPEFVGTVVNWSRSQYSVRMVVADEHGHGVRFCEVHELRPATREDLARAAVRAVADTLDEDRAKFLAETFPAIADGTAVPVRADKASVGMVVITAVRLEDRAIGTVSHRTGPGQPSVTITWEPQDRRDSVMGDRRVFSPDFHLVVTVESIVRLATGSLDKSYETPAEAAARARAEGAREARIRTARLEAQRLATNQVIEGHARVLLLNEGHNYAVTGHAGVSFRVNHIVVGLYAEDAKGQHSPAALDTYAELLERHGWFAEHRNGHHGPYLAVLPPDEQVRDMVEQGARNREEDERVARARLRARRYAAKWYADQNSGEPTDAALRAAFTRCVEPPEPGLYPYIRAELTGGDAGGVQAVIR